MTLGAKHPWALGRPASRGVGGDLGRHRSAHRVTCSRPARRPGTKACCCFSSGAASARRPTTPSRTARCTRTTAGSPACSASSPRRRPALIGERRLALLRDFGSRLASSQTTADVWAAVEHALGADSRDLPFTLAYLFEAERHDGDAGGARQRRRGRSDRAASDRRRRPVWPIARVLDGAAATPTGRRSAAAGRWPRGPWDQPPRQARGRARSPSRADAAAPACSSPA